MISDSLMAGVSRHRSCARLTWIDRSGRRDSISYGELLAAVRKRRSELVKELKPGHPVALRGQSCRPNFLRDLLAIMECGCSPLVVRATNERLLCGLGVGDVLEADGVRRIGARCPLPPGVSHLQLTSGTTGVAKAVLIGVEALSANLDAVAEALALDDSDCFCSWLPPHHDMGLVGGCLLPLVLGARASWTSPLDFAVDPSGWLQRASSVRASTVALPPFALRACALRSDARRVDVSALRTVVTGAEPIHGACVRQFLQAFPGLEAESIRPCYGMAECTLLASAGRIDGSRLPDAIVDSGRSGAGISIRVRETESGELRPTGTGELCISGSSLAMGYWTRDGGLEVERFRAESVAEPVFRTGDHGILDSAGRVTVTGRLDDQVKINGRLVALDQIEALLLSRLQNCSRCCVVELTAGTATVVIESSEKEGALCAFDSRHAGRLLKGHFGVERAEFRLVPKGWLPTTSSGKIRRSAGRIKHQGEVGG